MGFLAGFILGIIVATTGLGPLVGWIDQGVNVIKIQAQNLPKNGQIEESK